MLDMSKKQSALELKNKELEDSERAAKRTSLNDKKGQAAGKVATDQ